MTISSEIRKAGPFVGNGTATQFPFAFKVFKPQDVYVVRAAGGQESVLVLGTDYTVALNPDQNSNPGGTVTLPAALQLGQRLVVTSAVPLLQPTDLTNQGGFYPKVINDALDRATIQIQQLTEGLGRAAKLPLTSASDAEALTADLVRLADSADEIDTVAANIAAVNANAANITAIQGAAANAAAAQAAYDSFDDRYLGAKTAAPTTDNDGNALLVGATYWDTPSSQMLTWNGTQWRPTFLVGNTVRTVVTATGGQTALAAPTYLVGSNTIQVFVNGVKQILGTDYTETNQNAVTMAAGLTAGDEVELIAQQAFAVDELRADLASTAAGKGVDLVAGAAKQAELLKALSFSENADYRVVAGVIRQASNGSGWQFINDADHTPMNVVSITQNSSFITINLGFTAKKVLSFIVAPDETYARMGLVCGASVGLSTVGIQLAAPLAADVVYSGSAVNVTPPYYFSGDITGGVSGGELTITHPAVVDAMDVPAISLNRGTSTPDVLCLGDYTGTSFKVETHEDMCGQINWTSGTSFSVTHNTEASISATWDNTNKKLVVSHPTINGYRGTLLNPQGGSYFVEPFALGASSFEVKWFNSSGAYVDTPNAAHKCTFRLNGGYRTNPVKPTRFGFRRGYAPVNPTKLYSPGGNIWFIGVFKV